MRNLAFALAFLCLAVPVSAQEDRPDPSKTARVHIGPLAINPAVAISNVGIDTNVFNTWVDPKSDFTATVGPAATFWLRAGRTQLSGRANAGYVYFQTYASERAVNGDVAARYEANLFHVRPYAIASYLNTRDRPGWEIDMRARRYENAWGLGVDVPLTSRTTFGVLARRLNTTYAAGVTYLGVRLRDAFDRTEDTAEASFRYKVTSLTTIVVRGNVDRMRFTYTGLRNGEGFRVMPGVEFDAFAVVQGSAYAGVRKLNMAAANMPDYQGPVASVDLGYTLLGRTRLAAQAARDVYYSYDTAWPYYVQTGFTVSLTERIAGPFDAQARIGRQLLDYPLVGQTSFEVGRRDRVRFFGGGIGYRFGPSTRLGFNADSVRRTSQTHTREYQGLRFGTSLTYGF